MSRTVIRDPGGATLTLKSYDNHLVQPFPGIRNRIDALNNLTVRDDDVLVVGYPKSGNHWIWELCSRILQNNSGIFSDNMSNYLVELKDNKDLETNQFPRVLVSHLIPRIMKKSEDLFNGRHKMIYMIRNPKDVAVSNYSQTHTLRNLYKYEGTWTNYFEIFLKGQVDSASWFDHVLSWEKFRANFPNIPIHFVYYEELSKNVVGEIRRLLTFLGVRRNEYFIQQLNDVCQFSTMKKNHDSYAPDVLKNSYRHGQITMFRKGVVGDWRNTFTENQSKRLDRVFEEKMADSNLTIQFSNRISKL